MTSLCRHLSAQEIVNWVTTANGYVHTADMTQLDSFVASASAVCIGYKGRYGAMMWMVGADGVVGRVVLGSFMFSRGKELEHWNRITANVDEQIVQWHSLL